VENVPVFGLAELGLAGVVFFLDVEQVEVASSPIGPVFRLAGLLDGGSPPADQRVRTTSCSAVRTPALIAASTSSP